MAWRNAENLEIDSEISTDYNRRIIRVVGKMGETSDKLVVQAKLGDQEALCALLDLFSDQVASRLEKQINKKWKAALDIEDVLQVTYIEVFLQIGNFNGEEEKTFLAWLVRIAENNLRDAIRSLQCEKRPPPDKRVHAPSGQDSHITLIELVAGSSVTASRKAGRNEACDLLDAAMRKLPDDYEKVLRLYDLEGLSGPEVAEVMGRRRGAIHMLRSRALVRLGDLLGSESKFFTHKS